MKKYIKRFLSCFMAFVLLFTSVEWTGIAVMIHTTMASEDTQEVNNEACKGGIGGTNSVAKIMAKKCQCVVYASDYPYGLSYRKEGGLYYPRYGGKQNSFNRQNPLKKYNP